MAPRPHDDFSFRTDDGVRLRLRRYPSETGGEREPVLLLHGASAASNTFLVPEGKSFVDFLLESTALEPWLLDWRGSRNVTDTYLERGNDALEARRRLEASSGKEQQRLALEAYEEARAIANEARDRFDFDKVATVDIPAALERVEAHTGGVGAKRVVAHCMGAACFSRAIASGCLGESPPFTHVVLSTIGLFYEVAVDGRLKAHDRILERLLSREEAYFIDPTCEPCGSAADTTEFRRECLRTEWPKQLDDMYDAWPEWLRPHRYDMDDLPPGAEAHVLEMCNRLSFMYGEPYYEPTLDRAFHASPRLLAELFGAIPLRMYVHAAQCVRRGWAAPFEDGAGVSGEDRSFIDDAARRRFDDLHVTLITGAMNRLWHRDSVDRMYEWLKRDEGRGRGRYRKIIFKHNGHQDLFWGSNSWSEVFPRIAEALTLGATG